MQSKDNGIQGGIAVGGAGEEIDRVAILVQAEPNMQAGRAVGIIGIHRQMLARAQHDRIDEVKVMTEGARWTDEWGTEWGHAEGGVGATSLSCPLADLSRVKEYLAHRFPDARAPGRLDASIVPPCSSTAFLAMAINSR